MSPPVARRCRIRFAQAPDEQLRACAGSALAAVSPPPACRWENETLHLEYVFPDPGFEDTWRALCAAGVDRAMGTAERLRCTARALLEYNERGLLRHPGGWRRRTDRLYLACADAPGARAAGGRLWRKHEPDRGRRDT